MRFFALASLAVVTIAAVSGTTGVAPFDGSGAMIEEDRSVDQRLLGIHYISLKDGVKPEDFDRFVVEEWNPVLRDLLPGSPWMIMKGERNAREGEYLMVWDAPTVSVRDRYYPTPEGSEAWTAIWETCGEACDNVMERYSRLQHG
jgi:hypothetical protein